MINISLKRKFKAWKGNKIFKKISILIWKYYFKKKMILLLIMVHGMLEKGRSGNKEK